MSKKLPPLQFLIECFEYDKASGLLTWKQRPESHFKNSHYHKAWLSRFMGKPAIRHTNAQGYYNGTITYEGKQLVCLAHRIIWAMNYGFEPENIDHINCNKLDNRIDNLRKCTHSENMRNVKSSSSLPKGVCWDKRRLRYRATIYRDGSNRYIGNYKTVKEAKNAYDIEAIKLHGEFYMA